MASMMQYGRLVAQTIFVPQVLNIKHCNDAKYGEEEETAKCVDSEKNKPISSTVKFKVIK